MSDDGWKNMPGQPKTCAVCGKAVRLGKDAIWFRTSEPKTTWHIGCHPSSTPDLTPSDSEPHTAA